MHGFLAIQKTVIWFLIFVSGRPVTGLLPTSAFLWISWRRSLDFHRYGTGSLMEKLGRDWRLKRVNSKLRASTLSVMGIGSRGSLLGRAIATRSSKHSNRECARGSRA